MRLRGTIGAALIALAPVLMMLPLPGCLPAGACVTDAECDQRHQGWICSQICRPPPCETDAECAPGEECDPIGRCKFRSCGPDGTCPPGAFCNDVGSCTDECDEDAHCEAGQFCFEGSCLPKQCETSDDCPVGRICNERKSCTLGCRTDVDCFAGEFCEGSRCSTRSCTSDADCGGEAFCDGRGQCTADCRADSDCPAGQFCTDSQFCREGCRSDATCPAGTTCRSGQCEGTCRTNLDCAADERCTRFGLCVPNRCSTNADCPDGLACDPAFRSCRLPACRFDVQCFHGEECLDGRCVLKEVICGNTPGMCTPGVCAGDDACVSFRDLCRCVGYLNLGLFDFAEDSGDAGKSSGHVLTLQVPANALETYEFTLGYPGEFGFAGFDWQAQKSAIGAIEFDVNLDGKADVTVPLLPIDSTSAFADTIRDGRFDSAFEPYIRYRSGSHILTARLPMGGDGDPKTILTPSAAQLTFRLAAGVFTNPKRAGHYLVRAEALSVDPDTDGSSDRKGEPPRRSSVEMPIRIHGRAIAVDITPGAFPNALNPASNGVITLAILTTNAFDASAVNVSSVEFGPGRAHEAHGRAHREDVDGDGDLDLVLHFRVEAAALECGDTSAFLSGFTVAGEAIEGSDTISTVGCRVKRR